jgi:hypothetical protein
MGGPTQTSRAGWRMHVGTATRVGFYGCHVLDRPVRVAMKDEGGRMALHYPHAARLRCPCGNEHDVHLAWRKLKKDEPANPEVLI